VWRLDGSGAASRLAVDTTDEHHVTGYRPGGHEIVVEFPLEPGGLPVTHVLRASTGEVVDRLPGAYAPVPTDDPNVVFALFLDDLTFGRYDLSRHARIGPVVDPGFESPDLTVSGDRVLVWGFGEDRMRGVDLETGVAEPPLRLDDVSGIGVAVADADHLLTVECDANCYVQSRDPETGASVTEPYTLGQWGRVATGGGIFIVGTADGEVFQIDPDSLTPVADPFPETNGFPERLVVSEDGRRLAVLGADQLLRLYDVETRTQLGDAIPVGISWAGAALRGDRLEAAVATDQGIVIWDLDPDHWVDAACQIAGRNLTRSEWNQYVGDLAPYHRTCPDFAGA
jgi:hypothetical protein